MITTTVRVLIAIGVVRTTRELWVELKNLWLKRKSNEPPEARSR
jgi:hypothetical protein